MTRSAPSPCRSARNECRTKSRSDEAPESRSDEGPESRSDEGPESRCDEAPESTLVWRKRGWRAFLVRGTQCHMLLKRWAEIYDRLVEG